MMKKFFAIFLALTVVPTFNTYAWVGGPFDGNNLTPEGDDGIYEAVAIPRTGNGLGMYRFGVNNRNPGGTAFTNGQVGGTANVQFGGQFGAYNQHVWYFNGQAYYGVCFGSVNSAVGGLVSCTGSASTINSTINDTGSTGGPLVQTNSPSSTITTIQTGTDSNGNPILQVITVTNGNGANSFFRATMSQTGSFVAARNFFGTGELVVNVFSNAPVRQTVVFDVFGSRVSFRVTG